MITNERILELTRKNLVFVQEAYKTLHQNPELAFHEFETSKFVREELKALDIPFMEGFAQTGILGVLRCKEPEKRTIALRADMDALPVTEETNVPYRSKNDGVMHACGHDAHTASLLGVARILKSLEGELSGTFLFVFQPAEERYPGGANLMLSEGAFNRFKPDIMLGQHVIPSIPMGKVGFRPGLITAATDEIHITVHGQGGHAALLKDHNAVLAAANMLLKLNAIPAEHEPVRGETVLAFGRFIADGIMNVIPDHVRLDGTLRTLDEEWREQALALIKKIAATAVSEFGCSCEIEINRGYPSVINNEQLNSMAERFAIDLLGEENVTTFEKRMTGEDFGYYCQKFPSLFYRVGILSEKVESGGLHSPTFALDLDALETSTAIFAGLAIKFSEQS